MLPFSYIQLFAILFKSSLKNSGRRAMYSCPSHEKHTANAPLKPQPHPFGLGFLTGEEVGGGGFPYMKAVPVRGRGGVFKLGRPAFEKTTHRLHFVT